MRWEGKGETAEEAKCSCPYPILTTSDCAVPRTFYKWRKARRLREVKNGEFGPRITRIYTDGEFDGGGLG